MSEWQYWYHCPVCNTDWEASEQRKPENGDTLVCGSCEGKDTE